MKMQMINPKGLAIIWDFTAHWAIKIVQMVNIWKFNIKSKSWENITHWNCFCINDLSNISKLAIFSKYRHLLIFYLSVSCKIIDKSKWNKICSFDLKIENFKDFLSLFVSQISINSQNIYFRQHNIRTVFQDTCNYSIDQFIIFPIFSNM